jgi:Fanconi anemia group M protein
MEFLIGIEPRDYQRTIFEKCVEKNCLIVVPTGLGKTLIALMLAIERLKKFPSEKILFLAPTRPLVEQNFRYFENHLPELFADMNIFTGQVDAKERKKLWQNANIIFSTPQCIANDLRKRLYDLREVCLLVEDEAHRCIKNYDYRYIAENYIQQAVHQRIIGMTASPGSDNAKIKEICKNLSIEEIELKTRESEDVKDYLQELKFEKRLIKFPDEFNSIRLELRKLFSSYIGELKNRGLLWTNQSKTGLIELQRKLMAMVSKGNKNFNILLAISAASQAIKLQHAVELLETQTFKGFVQYMKELQKQAADKKSKGIIRLVNRQEFAAAFKKSEELLSKEIEHPKINELMKIISSEFQKNKRTKTLVFTQFRDTASVISEKLNQIHGITSKVFVGQAKKISNLGITGLNQKEQKKLITEFSSGEINVLCATSIGEEGLDIPEVNMVVFYESVPSAIRKIQRSGRTARLMKGRLIMLLTKDTRDETFYHVANAREKKMHKAIENIKTEIADGRFNAGERQETL